MSALGNLKAASFAQNEILLGDADILKYEFAFPTGRVIAAKGFEWPDDPKARRVNRDQNG